MQTISNSKFLFWFILALPAILMARAYGSGELDTMEMVIRTGTWAARLMVAAMAIGPLSDIFGSLALLRWLKTRRRWVGFAAFLYALAHLALYVIDMGALADIVAEVTEHGIWTGWAAMLLMAAPGFASNDRAIRLLGRTWKRVQQFAYPAALLTVLHWGLLTWEWGTALVYFVPLLALNLFRLIKRRSSLNKKGLIA